MYSASLSPIVGKKVARLGVGVAVADDVVFRDSGGRNATKCRKCAFGVAMGIGWFISESVRKELGSVVVVVQEIFRGWVGIWALTICDPRSQGQICPFKFGGNTDLIQPSRKLRNSK